MTNCAARLHGSVHAYQKYGCRCPEGIEAARAAWRRSASRRRCELRARAIGCTDYDEIAVVRAVAGDMSIKLTVPELAEAIARLDRRGMSARAVAWQLGVTPRTVVRHRSRRRASQEKSAAASPTTALTMPTPQRTVLSTANGTAQVRQEGVAA